MRDHPSVAVVMPAYNAELTLGGAISSALTQTRPPDEILVVDDGSADATPGIAAAHPAPVCLLQRENGGSSEARNTAIGVAGSDLVALLDADDQLLPHHLEHCVRRWQTEAARVGHERIIVTGNAYRLTRRGLTDATILSSSFPAPDQQRARILESNFVGIFTLYPRRLHEEVGTFDPQLRHGEDRELWARALFSGWHIVAQPEPQAIYRMGQNSLSTEQEKMASAEYQLLSKLRDTFSERLTATERNYLDMRLSGPSPRQLVDAANDAIRSSDWQAAVGHLEQASRLLPSDKRLWLRAVLSRRRWVRPALAAQIRVTDHKLGRMPG